MRLVVASLLSASVHACTDAVDGGCIGPLLRPIVIDAPFRGPDELLRLYTETLLEKVEERASEENAMQGYHTEAEDGSVTVPKLASGDATHLKRYETEAEGDAAKTVPKLANGLGLSDNEAEGDAIMTDSKPVQHVHNMQDGLFTFGNADGLKGHTADTSEQWDGGLDKTFHLGRSGADIPGLTLFMSSATEVLQTVERAIEQNNPFVWRIPKSQIGRPVQVLAVQDIDWVDVLMSCHTAEDTFACHRPLLSQTFSWAVVKFVDDGQIDTLMFAEHKQDADCRENCELFHHVMEIGVMHNFRVAEPIMV